MSASVRYRISWSRTGKDDGHREYKLTYLVATTDPDDGPQTALFAPGLPYPGAIWSQGNDLDPWAFCLPNPSAIPHQEKEGDPHRYWKCEFTFTTIPQKRCQDTPIEDPLLEPPKISGSFTNYTKEVDVDRNGNPIRSTSFEKLRGVEFDANRPTVKIEQNVINLQLSTFAPMINTLNNAALWGMSARRIKLSNVTWERKLLGSCGFYYTRTLEFDVDPDGKTFDREFLDEGSKVLHGQWTKAGDCITPVWYLTPICGTTPVHTNPMHYIAYKDVTGENTTTPFSKTFRGEPPMDENDVRKITVEYYPESNFMLLGIPTTL